MPSSIQSSELASSFDRASASDGSDHKRSQRKPVSGMSAGLTATLHSHAMVVKSCASSGETFTWDVNACDGDVRSLCAGPAY